jgi:Tol biopolymer transport system component
VAVTPTAHPAATAHPTAAPTLVHGRYLLALNHVSMPDDVSQPQALLLQPDGSGSHVIASGTAVGPLSPPNYNLAAVWARNGAKVHIIKGCDSRLSNVSALGGAEVPTVSMTNKDQGFLWSPDDTKIAYWHFTGVDEICEQNSVDDTVDLMVMNADGSNKRVLIHGLSKGDLTLQGWRPDGQALIAEFGNSWQTVNVSNGSAVGILGLPGTATRVEFSPGGTMIGYLNGGHAWVRAVLGALPSDLGAATDFAWKPDSTGMALLGSTLRVVNLGVSTTTTTVYAGAAAKATWSPDGLRIAFLKSYTAGKVFVVAATGGTVTVVPGPAAVTDVQWQP